MTAPWMDQPPTHAEVDAHAAAHGRLWWPEDPNGVPLGLWMWRSSEADVPSIGVARIARNELVLWDASLEDEWPVGDGGQWLPLTADGLPVALVAKQGASR